MNKIDVKKLIGITKEEAINKLKEENIEYRLVELGSFFVTTDYNENRMNIYIENEEVVGAYVG